MSIPKPREQDTVRACLDYLTLLHIPAWRSNAGALVVPKTSTSKRRFVRFNDISGLSDIVAVLPGGRAAFIECKRPGNWLTEDQAAFLDLMERTGAFTLVVLDLKDLIDALMELGYATPRGNPT